MNPWQTWLQAIQQNSTTNMGTVMSDAANDFTQKWESSWQQWQANMENTWASPASYWQAVSSIQTARSRAIAQFWQQQPQYFAGLFQCTTFPQFVEHMTRWNNAILANSTNLNLITQAHRGTLTEQWQRQFAYLSSNSNALQGMWKATQQATKSTTQTSWPSADFYATYGNSTAKPTSATTQSTQAEAPQASPKPQAQAAQSQPQPEPTKPVIQAETKIETKVEIKPEPKPEIKIETKVESKPAQVTETIQASKPTPQATQPVQPQVQQQPQATVTAIQTPSDQLHLMNGTNGSPIATTSNVVPAGTMTSTATSVMRAASGTTIAAAAAARRSVVARRSTSRRRAPR